MSNYVIINGELYHHGVKGMKWGVRRAQKREEREARKAARNENNAYNIFSKRAVKKGMNIVSGMTAGAGIGAGIGAVVGAGRTLFNDGEINFANILLTPLGAVKGGAMGSLVGAGAGVVTGILKKSGDK